MAASSKPTGLHFAIVFLSLFTVLFAVFAFVRHRDYTEAAAAAETARSEATTARRELQNAYDAIDALSKLAGHEFEQVGLDDRENPNTVLGGMTQDIEQLGGDLAQATLRGTLQKLREELDTVTQQRNEMQADLNDLQSQLLALENQYQVRVDRAEDARQNAEEDLRQLVATREELINDKNEQIAQLSADSRELSIRLEQVRENLGDEVQSLQEEVRDLTTINEQLRSDLQQVTQQSFETPDGQIHSVAHRTNMVWINLGREDNLPVRTSFSVYEKSHEGVARGKEDIKGAIEVTRIIGPHLSEARIVDEDFLKPITTEDPIYSPLWSPGEPHRFALVGFVDIDGDGQSDRELLRQLINSAGGRIVAEVDQEGNRTGQEINVNTKFLIVGEIPSPLDAPPGQQEAVEDIHQHRGEMESEARRNGVRLVRLHDFLSWMGYGGRNRLWIPGEDYPWRIQAGGRDPAVDSRYSKLGIERGNAPTTSRTGTGSSERRPSVSPTSRFRSSTTGGY